jgi:DNA-binding response OmpR family regulator
MKILVVDDDPDILDLLRTFCETLGVDVITAYDGNDALKKFGPEIPDMVLLDVMMPVRDGLSTLLEMKKISQKPKYIMITAYQDAEKILESYRQGAVDCLLKPIDFNYLRGLIGRVQNGVPAV